MVHEDILFDGPSFQDIVDGRRFAFPVEECLCMNVGTAVSVDAEAVQLWQ